MATVGEEPNFEVVQILVEILGQLEEMNGLADLSDSTSEDGSSVEEAEDVEMKVRQMRAGHH